MSLMGAWIEFFVRISMLIGNICALGVFVQQRLDKKTLCAFSNLDSIFPGVFFVLNEKFGQTYIFE